jgi:TolB-like protein/Flp pilus assembly protein TadD
VNVGETLARVLADRYRIERELGAGGMATVYLAEDLRHQRKVALKVLRPELAAVVGGGRFQREIQIAAQLQHPHILPLLDSGEAAGLLFYAMPYVEGQSLRERLTREKQLPVDDALRITREVADGLSYAHSRGVVHRDIKPENILLESGHAVIADFGIARAIDQAAGARLTETGMALGTPAYMSPEQAAGSRDLDGRSDLYSLGCMLFEMLAGQPPFSGPTVESVVHQHLAVEPPSITRIRPAVQASVAAALERALSKTPADRFNPVALFAEALGAPAREAVAPAAMRGARPAWRGRVALGLGAVALAIGAVAAGRALLGGRRATGYPRTAIAVLPLENLSPQGPYAYFAGGLHDELLTQLAKVAALTVIGRTSVAAYAGTAKPLREIGSELGVGSIVEGSVQVVGNRLRVIVQLIDPATQAHLWAEHYDRTLDDAFAVESDIAQRIVAGVGARLTSAEAGALGAAPTQSAEAYQLYLEGIEYYRRPGYERVNLETAQRLFERALMLDSTFAPAHAALSEVHGQMFWFRYDVSPPQLAQMRAEAETALRLAPDLPSVRVAMGVALYRDGDYRQALAEFGRALRAAPGDAGVWAWMGYAYRRLGNWDSVDVAFTNASRLDPRNANLFYDLRGHTCQSLRRYADAIAAYRQALTLAPDLLAARLAIGWTYAAWTGQLDTLRAVWAPMDAGSRVGSGNLDFLRLEREPDSLLALLGATHQVWYEDQPAYRPAALYVAWARELQGDSAAARAAFRSALALLDSVVRVSPDDWRVHAARGQALAGLGRRADAQREAAWLQQSPLYRRDRSLGPVLEEGRAAILARAGARDAALQALERLLAEPSGLSVPLLRLDPSWDPIRADPRFEALLVKYASPATP